MPLHTTVTASHDLALHDTEKNNNQNLNPIMIKAIVTPYITALDFTGTCPTYAQFTSHPLMRLPCLFFSYLYLGLSGLPTDKRCPFHCFYVWNVTALEITLRKFSPDFSFYKQLFQKTGKLLKLGKLISEWKQTFIFILQKSKIKATKEDRPQI